MKLDYDGFMLYASMHNEDVLKDILKFTSESWNDRMADSAASERGLHHFQTPTVRCAGTTALLPENRRVSGQSGADLQAVRAELLRSNAIRELGERVRAFMKEQPDIYERIYRETYGRAPNF